MSTAIRDNDTNTTGRSQGRLSSTKDRVRDTASSARDRASNAYESARERTSDLYGSARRRASGATDTLRSNPLAAVAGGIAIGAILAAVLPKSRREVQALGSTGARLNDKAREAAKNATDASRQKLDELGYQTVKNKLADVVGSSKDQQTQGEASKQRQQTQQQSQTRSKQTQQY